MAKKILVIDDDPVVVKYLTALFRDNGYETLQASDGTEGLKILKQATPDLITLDLEMEKQWGTQFYRTISKNPEYQDIPVIVVSGMPRPDLSIKKAVAVVRKPFDPDELLKIVRQHIGE